MCNCFGLKLVKINDFTNKCQHCRDGQLFDIYICCPCWLFAPVVVVHWFHSFFGSLFVSGVSQVRLVSHFRGILFEVIHFISFRCFRTCCWWKYKVAIIIVQMTRASVLLNTVLIRYVRSPHKEWLCFPTLHGYQSRFIFGEAAASCVACNG